MTSITAINCNEKPTATFNAVKIQVNDPKTNVPEVLQNNFGDSNFNGVNIEINRPSVEANRNLVYDYPEAKGIVTYNMSGITPVKDIPALPVSYQTNINNVVSNEVEMEQEASAEEEGVVPRPSLTNPEFEKKLSFHGSPKVSNTSTISNVMHNLDSSDYDVQALALKEIYDSISKSSKEVDSLLRMEVFEKLINIVKKDTKDLQGPTEKQTEIRKKIIINEVTKNQAKNNNQDMSNFKIPYELSKEEINEAIILAPMEQAERNKEYAMLTIAKLANAYNEKVKEQTGSVVPITDLPGISIIVDTLRHNPNKGLKRAALEALSRIDRPEYSQELNSIFALALQSEK